MQHHGPGIQARGEMRTSCNYWLWSLLCFQGTELLPELPFGCSSDNKFVTRNFHFPAFGETTLFLAAGVSHLVMSLKETGTQTMRTAFLYIDRK